MKKLLSVILAIVISVLCIVPVFAETEAETVTEIRTAEDLNNIRNNLSGKYILMNDIDLSSYENWEPIGSSETPFTGELDGNGFTISNITVKEKTADNGTFYCGLFGNAGGSVIKNAIVSDAEIDVEYIGSDSESKCKIGTIAGYGADISDCTVTGKMNIKGFSSSEIGGIIGGNLFGAVSQCANYADINAEIDSTATKLAIGGIIGYSKYTEISECCNFGSVSADATDLQSSCYIRLGGIEGNGSDGGTVIDCYNRGKLSVDTSNKRTYIGGISGQSRNTINVYNTGNVIIPEEFNGYSGAISGSVYSSALTSTSEKSEMKNAFYNNSEMIPAYLGKFIPESYEEEPFENIVNLTEEEFKKQESFVGFDFETVWEMEENGYPVLQNQPELPETEPTPDPETVTEIRTAEDLNNIRNNLSGKYILMNDIDLSSYENWEPIGSSETPFTGELDGNGFSILNMTIIGECTDSDSIQFGLFNELENCTVKNLNILNIDIDIKFTGNVSEQFRVGALAGFAINSTLENCVVSGNINIEGFEKGYAGGFLGLASSCMPAKCVNYANINLLSKKISKIGIGGIAGKALAISKCCNYGNITVSSVDSDDSNISAYVGGIVGEPHQFGNMINNCYNRGTIELDFSTASTYVGGLAGESMVFCNSYNSGEIILPENFKGFAGGLSGNNLSWVSVPVEPGNKTGNAYYINESFYPSYSDGYAPDDNSFENVKLLTEEEFKKQESFVGFDFETVWTMEENGYPVLQNQPELPETEPTPDPDTVTEIRTAEDLYNIRNDLDGKYILMNDIDLSVYENWEPIGVSGTPFIGQFDGNGFIISSLTINTDYFGNENAYYGLFGYISGASDENIYKIKNLVITDASVNVKYSGNETSRARIGILAGFCSAAGIFNCAVTGEIFVEGFSACEVGGIVGRCTWSDISSCVNYANINVSANTNSTELLIGGISGIAKRSGEQYCCNYGNISVKGNDAQKTCIVKMGGIDGDGSENISLSDSYNRGDLSVDFSTPQTYMGGISGESYISENVYSCGKLFYPEDFYGYAGAVSGNLFSSVLAVGLPSELKNAYYTDTENIPAYDGESIPDDFMNKPFVNVKLLTEEEFKKQESFVGFDFETVWEMEENGYPVLQNLPELPEIDPTPDPEPDPDPDPEPTPDPEPVNNVKSAEIVYVPLKNRIVFGFGSPNTPDGIVLKLTYKDGTEKTETIVRKDNGYFAGDESVIGGVHLEVVRYGRQTEMLFINEAVKVEYDYFVIPPIFQMILSFFQRELFVIA